MGSIKAAAAIQRVMELIAIRGGSGDEGRVAEYLTASLAAVGVPRSAIAFDSAHRRSPQGGSIGNMIVRLPGTVRGPRRLLMAHMDTVPIAVDSVPVRRGDWISPRAATTALGGDNRGGCAVVLTAVIEALTRRIDHPPLTLLFTIQEEIGLRGARYLTPTKLGRPELCFNWDGRGPADLVTGAVGASNLAITIQGIASHAGAHPERGVNAAVAAALAISALQKDGWHGLVKKRSDRGASNVGTIRGGEATNVVMPEVVIEAEVRSHDAAFRTRIVGEWRTAFLRAVEQLHTADGRGGQLSFEEDVRYEAFRMDPAERCVAVAAAAATHAGLSPVTHVCDGGLDANWMAVHGFPAVTMGCGQYDIHTVAEKLHIPEYLDACRMALSIATGIDAS